MLIKAVIRSLYAIGKTAGRVGGTLSLPIKLALINVSLALHVAVRDILPNAIYCKQALTCCGRLGMHGRNFASVGYPESQCNRREGVAPVIPESEIARECSAKATIARAREIAKSGKLIFDRQCSYKVRMTVLSACVTSSSWIEDYDVQVGLTRAAAASSATTAHALLSANTTGCASTSRRWLSRSTRIR